MEHGLKKLIFLGAELSSGDSVVESWFNQPLDLNDPQNWVWQNRLCHSSSIIRRSLHERLGPSRSDLRFTPDWDLWIRALAMGARFFVIQEPLTFSRQHGGNITHQNPLRTVEEYADITAITLNPYLISQSRFDLVVRNLRGFWSHPAFDSENTQGKEKVFGNALGFREQGQGTDETSSARFVIPVVTNLLEQCQILEAQQGAALADRDAALADRDTALADRDTALADRDTALADRDTALAELYEVYRSTSWGITKPIRSFVSNTRSFVQVGSFLLFNAPSVFTWARLKKGLTFLRTGDVPGLKSALVSISRENAKRARRASKPELIPACSLSQGQPLVSVIIPCFNYGRYVIDAVDSILAQTLKNVEIIVVDGGSTDTSTVETLRAIQRPSTTILFREGRHLVGDNRNYGIEKANGRYICCLDADDTLDPTYLEKAVFHLETYGYDVVSTAINYIGAKEGQLDILEFPDLTDMVSGNHVLTCAVFRRQLWESVGGYFDIGVGQHHVAEDWDFWLRSAAKGARIRNISGEYLFNYRIHEGGSLSSSADVKPLADQQEAIFDRNRELLTPEAFSFSTELQSKYLRCEPSETALAMNFNTAPSLSKKTLLLAMPFSMVGGAERLLSGLCIYLADHDWRIIVVTTLDQDASFGSSIDWFKKSSLEIYALPRFLEPGERGDFLHYLIMSRKPDCLLNAGSRLVYEMLPSIKKSYETLCIVDLLFNTVGHVKSHMEFKKFLTFALAENQEVYDWYLNVAGWPANRVRKMSSGVNLELLYSSNSPQISCR